MKRAWFLLLSITLSLGLFAKGNPHGETTAENSSPKALVIQTIQEVLKEGSPEITQDFISNFITIHLFINEAGRVQVLELESSNPRLNEYVARKFKRNDIYLDSAYAGKSYVVPVRLITQ